MMQNVQTTIASVASAPSAGGVPNVPLDQSMRTIQKKRTANFREDETRLLIQLWGSPAIQNKLFLTHRKAPVMRLLAANMQQRGFYRTPDEIKTRIRNLKCLYHRIKRSMSSGTGIGTVDPDWPHFKAMDDILSKEYPRKLTDRIMEEQMETKFEDIKVKQEIDDIDIDDNDSWATNDSNNSEYDDDASQDAASPMTPMVTITKPPPIQPGSIQVKKTSSLQVQPMIRLQAPPNQHPAVKTHIPIQPAIKPNPIMNTIQIPTSQVGQNGQIQGQKGGIPFPVLILNSLNQDKNAVNKNPNIAGQNQQSEPAQTVLLKELIDLQKQTMALAKEQVEIEKQRLEYDRVIGTQLATILPMLGGVLQRLTNSNSTQVLMDMKFDVAGGVKRKRSASEDAELAKDSKKLATMLEKGIRKYMLIDGEPQSDPSIEKIDDKDSAKDANENKSDKGDDDAEKRSDKNRAPNEDDDPDAMEDGSVDGDILEPNVVIEHIEDDDENDDDADDDDDDEEEKLVIETRRSPRARRSH